MFTTLLTSLRTLVPTAPRRLLVVAALASTAGLLEAVTLVCIVQVALIAAGNGAELPAGPLVDATAPQLLGTALAFVLIVLVLHYAVAQLHARLMAETLREARLRIVEAYFGASYEHLSEEREGSLQESVSTLATQTANFAGSLVNLISAGTQLVALLTVSFIVDPAASLVVLGFGGLVFLCLRPISRLTRRRAGAFVRSNAEFTEDAGGLSSDITELKVFGVVGPATEQLRHQAGDAASRFASARLVNRFGSTLYRDLAALFLIAAVAWIYWGSFNVAGVGAVVVLIVRAVNTAQTAQSALQMLGEQQPNIDELMSRIDKLMARTAAFGDQALDSFEQLELVEVSYRYGAHAALENASLVLNRHDVLGIVGPSGGGKTTLLQVLLRLRLPTTGHVLVNGVDYTNISPAAWSNMVSAVPQEPRLVPGSIRHNVAYYRDVDDDAVLRALDQAHLTDTVSALPNGLDTLLGPRGSGLSGGQKQRLALARALVTQPSLLVLDEPTSALDEASEEFVRATIEDLTGTTTIVLVAHRPSTLQACSRIARIVDGSLAIDDASDSHNEPSP